MAELARIAALPGWIEGACWTSTRSCADAWSISAASLSKLVNSPPGFGARDTGSTWMEHLYHLNREPGFRKVRNAESRISKPSTRCSAAARIIWRDLLPRWRLTGTEPYGIAARPSAALLKRQQQETQERIQAEVRLLKAKYNVDGRSGRPFAAIETDYDAESKRLDDIARARRAEKFLDSPPLTLDDQLEYKETKLADGVPLVSSFFDNMTSATTALALRLDVLPGRPTCRSFRCCPRCSPQTGVIMNGKPIPYEQMQEMLRREILDLTADFRNNLRSNRVELLVQGAGNDLNESRRAMEWMRAVLAHPDWRPENLPRIRDLVEQSRQPPARHRAEFGRGLGHESGARPTGSRPIRSI